jgi:hypothetical protein
MTSVTANRFTCGVFFLCALHSASSLRAQISTGTWVRQSDTSAGGTLMMTAEPCCNGGRRLSYRIKGGDAIMTIESPMDGRDVPVLAAGKPSGETMGIKRVDDYHTVTVLKMNGKTVGTSRSTLSADGKTLTVENEMTSTVGGQTVGKQTETWVRR